jgi:hypothetical protein
MGGGLFGTELALNPKCLAFAGFVLAVYWMPHPVALSHRIIANFILACLAYVALAWYDVLYDCNDRFEPTLLGWLWKPLKPKEYQDKYDKLSEKTKKVIRTVDIAVLVILVVLAFVPYVLPKTFVRTK